MTDNPNAPNKWGETLGETPIYLAAKNGHSEIVKILVPLTKTPNAPNKDGQTPMHLAAMRGYSKIVRILKQKLKIQESGNMD